MDVVQESVYKAIAGAGGLHSGSALKSWLCSIVVNTALDLLRKQSRETASENLPEEGRGDVYRDLDTLRALDALDEKERTVVVLRFFTRELEELRRQYDAIPIPEGLKFRVKSSIVQARGARSAKWRRYLKR